MRKLLSFTEQLLQFFLFYRPLRVLSKRITQRPSSSLLTRTGLLVPFPSFHPATPFLSLPAGRKLLKFRSQSRPRRQRAFLPYSRHRRPHHRHRRRIPERGVWCFHHVFRVYHHHHREIAVQVTGIRGRE